jgi:hypothetical protein
MHPSTVCGSTGLKRSRAVAVAISTSIVAAMLAASSQAATSPTSRACPSASIVNAALGQHDGAPVVTKTAYSKTCTYPAKNKLFSPKITFQVDSAAQFATDEKAASKAGLKIIKLNNLGKAAWTTGSGDLYIIDGHEQIKILALMTPTAKLETLARKLL